MPTPSPRAYTFVLLATTALLLATTAIANYVIDPYGIYWAYLQPGFNADKPGQKGHDRLVKAYAIRAKAPDALLLGTSRVQYGLDPNDPSLKAVAERPYNGGLLGSNIYLALRYLQHAEAMGHVKVAVVGLDPLMFNEKDSDAGRDFSETRLAMGPDGAVQTYGWLSDIPSTLLSWDTTRLSLRTCRKQGHIVTDLLPSGQRSQAALDRLFGGEGTLFDRFISVDKEYVRDYRKALWPQAEGPSASMAALDNLLAFATEHHIRLELYFTPEHAHLQAVAEWAQAQGAIDTVRRRIAISVAAAQKKAQGSSSITLWDMAGVTPYATEAVPRKTAAEAPLTWFWEPTHAKDALGHLILERMLAPEPSPQALAVGDKVTPLTLGRSEAARTQALRTWRQNHGQEAQDLAAALAGMPTE